jgi:KDO2-lipid IV(A) lauroyltransferase
MLTYKQLAHPRYWLAWTGLSLLWLITRLPYRWQFSIGKMLGNLLSLFPSKLKNITLTNLQLCFPELTPTQQQILMKENFTSLGIGLIEMAMAWWLSDKKLKSLFHISGLEHAEEAFARGKGIMLVGPHFTSLEIVARLVGMHYSFAVMYRPHKKSLIAFIQERFRNKYGIHFIPRNRMRELLRTLQQNKAIWYAYDVDGGEKNSVFAPFFKIPTASLTTVSRIVELTDATVLPICFYRNDKKLHYEIKLEPALSNFPTHDLTQDATRLNALLEKFIRQKPEQYVWPYKRFKTRPAGEKKIY